MVTLRYIFRFFNKLKFQIIKFTKFLGIKFVYEFLKPTSSNPLGSLTMGIHIIEEQHESIPYLNDLLSICLVYDFNNKKIGLFSELKILFCLLVRCFGMFFVEAFNLPLCGFISSNWRKRCCNLSY